VGTMVSAQWYYIEGDPVYIDGVALEINDTTTDFLFSLSKPDNNWPKGHYQVDLYIDDNLEQSVNFSVI
jgi:hypothetical protein